MAKGFLGGFSWAENLSAQWMGYLGATLTKEFTRMRAGGVDVSLRDVTIARDRKRGYRGRMTSRTGCTQGILGIWSKLGELRLDTGRDGWLSLAREGLGQVPHEMGGADEKARIERLCLSLLMSKNF